MPRGKVASAPRVHNDIDPTGHDNAAPFEGFHLAMWVKSTIASGRTARTLIAYVRAIPPAIGTASVLPELSRRAAAFSANDERTAKRVSDALGTATEMRAMKNYAGHRLSPWLGHLMVSRQETSRPLLTPGEVMQLSPGEAIVMISGLHPVRATKVRYYEDPQFQRRGVEPPPPPPRSTLPPPAGDWSGPPQETCSALFGGEAFRAAPPPAPAGRPGHGPHGGF